MTARWAARRHRDEVGEVIAVHSDRPGRLVVGGFFLVWLVASGLTLIKPGENLLLAVAPAVIFAIIIGLVLLYVGSEKLVVCERGLVIGSVAPGLRPYVVRYEQIVPGSVVPVTGARRYGKETGSNAFPQSTVRRNVWTGRGIHVVGPSPKEARRHNAVLAPLQDPPPLSIDGRWVWFAGTSSTPPEQVTAQIARAAGVLGLAGTASTPADEMAARAGRSNGLTQLAQAAAQAPVRELSGNPADASRHLPGLPQ